MPQSRTAGGASAPHRLQRSLGSAVKALLPGILREGTLKGAMAGFSRNGAGRACFAGAPLSNWIAKAQLRGRAYFYDLDAIRAEVRDLRAAFGQAPHLVAYAVKANTAGSVLKSVADEGGGADVVSGGELLVALGVGMNPRAVVFSGVGKSDEEIDLALKSDLLALQIESVEEIARVARRAKEQGSLGRVSLRINPDVEIDSHAHIATGHDEAKFGIVERDLGGAFDALAQAKEYLCLVGISTHVGSMLSTVDPYLDSARVVCRVAHAALEHSFNLEFLDFGGGFGISTRDDEVVARPADFARASLDLLRQEKLDRYRLLVEPGRALVAPHGVLVTRIIQTKKSGTRRWCMVDAGMNDLIRPALYAARHRIEPVEAEPSGPEWQVVGPVCESADDFGLHALGDAPKGFVVIRDAGAYGYTMASSYNGRNLPQEVFLSQGAIANSRSWAVQDWVDDRLRT